MQSMTESLQEVIRVLQLTSPTEEQGAFAAEQGAGQTGLPGGMLPGSLAAKIFQAKELVSQTGMGRWEDGFFIALYESMYIHIITCLCTYMYLNLKANPHIYTCT